MVTESLAQGREVWVLNDFTEKTKPAERHKYALYVAISRQNLEYVITKESIPPGMLAEEMYGKKEGCVIWRCWPAGETRGGSGKTVTVQTWQGDKHKGDELNGGAEAVMALTAREEVKITSDSGNLTESVEGAGISLEFNGDQVRWNLQATSATTLTTKERKFPPITQSREDSGAGRRIRLEKAAAALEGRNEGANSNTPVARRELMKTAETLEGPFVEVIKDIVDAVESGEQPWSVADSRIYENRPGKHQFAAETITAYMRWRHAKIDKPEE
ncbi:hypothetical protein V5E97_23305 [Singulisphaera sp. Ch08]|uniref:Uncharacterized protein n=1 Tax=Singulisphaera sp. Ch08 TaxID=3120278 RepID=A0AAU7C8H2_9BACT